MRRAVVINFFRFAGELTPHSGVGEGPTAGQSASRLRFVRSAPTALWRLELSRFAGEAC